MPLASQDKRQRVEMKPSTILHLLRSHKTAQVVYNPKRVRRGNGRDQTTKDLLVCFKFFVGKQREKQIISNTNRSEQQDW